MQFDQPLLEATLVRRQKKFVADVRLDSGEEISVHCANPGSLLGCSEPGSKVLISKHDNPRLRLRHQLEIIYAGKTPVAIHTGRPAGVVAEAITQGRILELAGYATLRREARNDRLCRLDLVVEGNGLRTCYMQVINVTLAENGVARYPDSIVPDGQTVMQILTNLVREGNRVMVMFVPQRADVTSFRLADDIDPDYAQAFRDAVARGVETACYRAKVTRKGIELDKALPVDLSES